MLAIGMTGESCRHALAAAEEHEEIYVSVGRHPHESAGFDDAGLEELRELSAHPKARAVGEAGLDYKRDYAPRADQRRSFIAQIDLAKALGRPLVVHTREAADDTIALLDDHGQGVDVIIHCFSLSDHVEECVQRRWYCSFAGNVTYPKATDLQRAAADVPDELLLAETDAPFLSPQERRSKPNEPAYVRSTSRYLAKLRDTSVEEMEDLLVRNAARLFGW
jgi:TatD DNase family protein